jgi:hypothetical protein
VDREHVLEETFESLCEKLHNTGGSEDFVVRHVTMIVEVAKPGQGGIGMYWAFSPDMSTGDVLGQLDVAGLYLREQLRMQTPLPPLGGQNG